MPGDLNGLATYYDMSTHKYSKIFFFLCLVLSINIVKSQTLPVSDQLMRDYYRIKQLEGIVDSSISFNVQPLSVDVLTDKDSNFVYLPKSLTRNTHFIDFKIFPLNFTQQFNSDHPYGWNDGLMIPAKGYQQYISGGVFLKAGPLTIQALPEFIYASNPPYLKGNEIISSERYTQFISGADLPDYFETENYSTFGIGQSSIRLNFGSISLGISNENLWWGPGRKNSILMSNSSRGFKHATLNTLKPVQSPIGSFEGQIISGRLENSNSPLNSTKNPDWRYLSGMVINYQPRWVPGLFLGLTRVFQAYNTDVNSFGDYFPLLQSFEKKKTSEDAKNRDQLTSMFARYVFRKANAEIYAEFGRNDHSFDIRDFAQEPQHSRAYLFGFQKIVSQPSGDQKFLISAEVTQLSQPLSRMLRSAGTWYVHSINQGYTNGGEVIGAGSGPGGNLQTFEFSWLSGLRKIGLQLERYEHNRDYYQQGLDSGDDFGQGWVDISLGLLTNWDYKNLIVRSRVMGIQSLNYLWQTGLNDIPKKNVFNIHANFGLYYYLK